MPTESRSTRADTRRRVAQPSWFDLVMGLLFLGLGVALPLSRGVDTATVLVTLLCGVVIGAAVCLLPGRVRPFAWLGALLLGALVGSFVVDDEGWFVSWLFSYFLGVLVGLDLLHLRQRTKSAPGERETATGVRLRWDEGADTREVDAPGRDEVVEVVRALDGQDRGFVSVLRGRGRLDVAGSAVGRLMVYQCDDASDHRATWYHLTSPEAGDGDEEVSVRAGGIAGHFPRRSTTTLAEALRAAEHYLASGRRDPALAWHGSRDVADMRHPVLQASD